MRYLTKKKKRERKEANAKVVREIYERALQRGSADYLTVNQESEPERVAKILAQADERRKRKGLRKVEQPKDTPSQVAGLYGPTNDSGLFKDSRGTLYVATRQGVTYRIRGELKQ